jgi:hypothetical protein
MKARVARVVRLRPKRKKIMPKRKGQIKVRRIKV